MPMTNSDTPKLLFVLENYVMGGVERVTYQLLSTLKQSYPQIDVTVVHENEKGDFYKEYQALYPSKALFGKNYREKKRSFSQLLSYEQPDIVIYTKGGLSKYTPLFKGSLTTKFVAIQHVPIDLPESSWLKNLVRKLGAAILYRRIDHIICVSNGIKQNLVDKLFIGEQSITTIYNPVLDINIKELANEPVEYSNYFVCVGRLHYQKGYDILLKIASNLKQQNEQFTIVILGDGEDKPQLEHEIKKQGLAEHVILHGQTSNPYKYIKQANAILLPSRWEGLPTVLVEAAYLNTQIIAFDCRYGPSELTNKGDNGFLVDMLNEKQFSTAMTQVIRGATKPLPATTAFTKDAATEYYLTIFNTLMTNTSPQRLLDNKIHCGNEFSLLVDQLLTETSCSAISFVNPFSYMEVANRPELIDAIDYFFSDGALLCKLHGLFNPKVARASFDFSSIAHAFLTMLASENHSIAIIGAKQDEVELAVEKLQHMYPTLNVVYYRNGYIDDAEQLIEQLNEHRPKVVLLGMGSPYQENMIMTLKPSLRDTSLIITCGGFLTQTSIKADYYHPMIKKLGLRWLQRMWMHKHVRDRVIKKYPVFLASYLFHRLLRKR